MILFIVIAIYIPNFFHKPRYNFLYSSGREYFYLVRNNRLQKYQRDYTETYYPYETYTEPQLYIYNVKTNNSMAISYEDASRLVLNNNRKSPDGYTIENGSVHRGFFPFFWYDNNYDSKYLVGKYSSKKVDLENDGSTYSNGFSFLGWVVD